MASDSSLQRPTSAGNKQSQSFRPPPTHPAHRDGNSLVVYDIPRVVPPKLPPRPQRLAADAPPYQESQPLDFTPGSFDVDSVGAEPATLPEAEEELSEVQLRELYDDEEIDRFLHLFSAYVREARIADTSGKHSPKHGPDSEEASSVIEAEIVAGSDAAGDWVPLDETTAKPSLPPLPPRPIAERSFSEWIALDYMLPLLPPAPPQPPAFTLQRLQLSAQRIYLATKPAYVPFIARLVHLATWQETNTSLVYCAAYWLSWYHNFLMPVLMLRILYALIRRKLLPYPSLEELREHRLEVDRAKEFSVAITSRLVASPTYDVQDVWRLLVDLKHSRKMKQAAKHNGKGKDTDITDQDVTMEEVDTKSNVEADAKSNAEADTKSNAEATQNDLPRAISADEVDVKRAALAAVNDIADLHERIKNIFLWRRPASSMIYGTAIVGMFLLTLLPAKYLAKLLGFVIGVGFWHIVPIIAAIPPAERVRFPKPFTDVPTDAEYAMELISQRVARGLEIKPKKRKPVLRSKTQDSNDVLIESEGREGSIRSVESSSSNTSVNWKKWGDRVATTKARTGDVKRMFQDGQWKRPENWLALNPLAPRVALPYGTAEPRLRTYTFPAQHAKASGLITLTSDTFHFTSLLSSTAKVSIPLTGILGIKKTGPMRGLNVRWTHTNERGEVDEREESFIWVGARNELFARLVAWGGRRWANV